MANNEEMIQRKARFGFNTHGHVIPIPFKGEKKNVTIIAAIDKGRGIGVNGTIPWSLKPDMVQFAKLTRGHPVIMGRKTHESLPFNHKENARVLPGRLNIVITRNPRYLAGQHQHANLIRTHSLREALALAGNRQTFIIGGAEIYSQALCYANDLILTEVQTLAQCDTFFPDIDPKKYLQHQLTEHDFEGMRYTFQYWRRWQNELLKKGEPRYERFLLAEPEVPGRQTPWNDQTT